MLLKEFVPVYDFNEIHAITVDTAPSLVFRAIKEVTPAEVPLFRLLFGIRSLPSRLHTRGRVRFIASKPLYDQAVRAGFVSLGEVAMRELVFGIIGQFWNLWRGSYPRVVGAEEFLAYRRPGYAKVATNFYLDAKCGDYVKLSTETRIYVPDPITRKKFAVYWALIHPGSALVRLEWLRAIKKRAERA